MLYEVLSFSQKRRHIRGELNRSPFFFVGVKNTMQPKLATVEISQAIFELIDAKALITLPVHISKDVRPADLICFECPELECYPFENAFLYAIVESTSYWKEGLKFADRLTHVLVRFRVVRVLTDIVIS